MVRTEPLVVLRTTIVGLYRSYTLLVKMIRKEQDVGMGTFFLFQTKWVLTWSILTNGGISCSRSSYEPGGRTKFHRSPQAFVDRK